MSNNKESNSHSSTAQENGSTLPLFYKSPMPLDAKKHGNLSLKKNFGFGFTKGVNAVPVNMVEMPQICHHYPTPAHNEEDET